MIKLPFIRRFCSGVNKNFYITTPIFYVNAPPHIGHLYSAVVADTIARYEQLKHPSNNIRLSTGTDEHGIKIQQAALHHKIPVEKYCNQISEKYRHVFDIANVKYTNFIRTTDETHKTAVQSFWNTLNAKNLIYPKEYSGWYCVADETFLTDSQTKLDNDGNRYSLESNHLCEWTVEPNYMFPLGQFQGDIIKWIESANTVTPKKFKKILLDYLNEPLSDLSISRPSSRMPWGIPVPGDNTQNVYVWLDALVNYLTCVGYPNANLESNWPPNVQVIGKDILKFHGIYWPAFCIAADIEPPKKLLVHSHWTVDGQKMSKSKFNVVDPLERAETYTMEGLRYFLLREGVPHSDGNYSEVKIKRILNSELADTLGNLLSRTCSAALNPKQIYPEVSEEILTELLQTEATKNLIESIICLAEKCRIHYESHNFYLVVDQIIAALHITNYFFENSRPWVLKKGASDENQIKLETIIALAMDSLRTCCILLQPIIPEISNKVLNKLCVKRENRFWKDIIFDANDSNPSIGQKYILYRNQNYENQEKKLSSLEDTHLFRRIVSEDEKYKKIPQPKIKSKKKSKI